MKPHPDPGFARGLCWAIPISIALWVGMFFLWKRVFSWLGGVL